MWRTRQISALKAAQHNYKMREHGLRRSARCCDGSASLVVSASRAAPRSRGRLRKGGATKLGREIQMAEEATEEHEGDLDAFLDKFRGPQRYEGAFSPDSWDQVHLGLAWGTAGREPPPSPSPRASRRESRKSDREKARRGNVVLSRVPAQKAAVCRKRRGWQRRSDAAKKCSGSELVYAVNSRCICNFLKNFTLFPGAQGMSSFGLSLPL